MIHGVHALLYAKNANKARAFFRDVLGFRAVDAGEGWLIFALPPAELGVHPAEGKETHRLYFMCDDIRRTIAELAKKGVKCGPVEPMGWGLATSFTIPGGGKVGMYEPRHATAITAKAKTKKKTARRRGAAKRANA